MRAQVMTFRRMKKFGLTIGVVCGIIITAKYMMLWGVLSACCVTAQPPLKVLTASLWGTPGDDDLQGVCRSPDGSLYVVGNTAEPVKSIPGGSKPVRFGEDIPPPALDPGYAWRGVGYVAQVTEDGSRILRYAEFPPGMVFLTTVLATNHGVYVAGYASETLEILLHQTGASGLLRKYPLTEAIQKHRESVKAGAKDPIAGRPGLGRYGAPFVLRLSMTLDRIEAGTYLEGWQQVWEKRRFTNFRRKMEGGWLEYYWQPTHLAALKSGDLIVGHDGGYFRLPKPEDRALAGDNPKLAEQLLFYDVCDYISRLSPDLSQRAWVTEIYTPAVNPEVARQVKDGWPLPHYGNPRTLRVRLDANERIYLCGWSASATSQEPWWSPYVWVLDSTTGQLIKKAYEYDPMSGGGNRMGGMVADTAVTSIAVLENGEWLVALLADGGNTVMGLSPKADGSRFEKDSVGPQFPVHLVHWWGNIHRVDGRTLTGLARARIGPWGWAVDLTPLPNRKVLVVGRCNGPFQVTPDAWYGESEIENPIAFLRVYDEDLHFRFSTLIPGIVPFEIVPLGQRRFAIPARADAPPPLRQNSWLERSPGGSDGYLLIVEYLEGG